MASARVSLIRTGPDSEGILKRLVHRKLAEGEPIALPDLPIVDAAPSFS